MSVAARSVSDEWFLHAFGLDRVEAMPEEVVAAEVDLVLKLLRPKAGARLLDLACGMGQHSLEAARRGFEILGLDACGELIAVADGEAEVGRVDNASYLPADIRVLDLDPDFQSDLGARFDAVLSLHGGAIGYFANEDENRRPFEIAARALRPGGRHLAQLPNVRHVEERLLEKDWRIGEIILTLVEQRWNPRSRFLEGETTAIAEDILQLREPPLGFRQRLYTVEELREIYAGVGMRLVAVFDSEGNRGEDGDQAEPGPEDEEIFVLAEKA